jgi:hypothetical protein
MSDQGLCGTCGKVVHDADAVLCKRPICDARNVVARSPREIRPPQVNPGEVIDYTDAFAGIGDSWDKWSAVKITYDLPDA